MSIETGGPAFPAEEKHGLNSPAWGITVRDYFAARAPEVPDDFGWAPREVDSWARHARWSYVYADAMLRAREDA